MSNEVDSRVVEMRFDNQQFERNVGQSLSTLDKLKAALRLDGVSKGLDDVNASAKKLDFRETVQGIDNVVKKFTTMELVGGVTIANLTNEAVNSAKNLAKALTFDPVKSGLQEYETQINAVQTILANTSHAGTTIDDVNAALDELNQYADMTIYNFTEMTKNIGTFTAAGIDLETSTNAIKGIANLAAVSGSTSQQASTAMYQLSQALAAGSVKLQDWNSVVNAGMGGKVFQDALIRTSELMGTGAKNAIEAAGSFRESLTKGQWITKEVLTETLKQFAGAYDKAELMAQGYTEEQAEEITKMATTATDAATKVKTFTQLIDTLKEAVQSGWSQTFRILIGDFEEAKAMWTSVSDFFNGIIGSINDARNRVLESAFGTMFSNLESPLESIVPGFSQATETVEGMTTALSDLDAIADRVISGEFGNMQVRWDLLTEEGWNWISVQNKVNEKLGVALRRDEDLAEGYRGTAEAAEDLALAEERRAYNLAVVMGNLMELSNETLREQGYTFDQIKALRDLERVAKKTGIPLEELVENLGNLNGRWVALRALKNIGDSIVNVAKEIKHAWYDVFEAVSDYEKGMRLFDMIGAFNKVSDSIKAFTENEEQMDKIGRTFRGLFSAIDIVQKILGAGFKIVLEIVSKILENFGLNILDVTAAIGDAITAFNNWLEENETFKMVINAVADAITVVIKVIGDFINYIMQIPQVQYVIENFGSILEQMASNVSNFLGGFGDEIKGVIDRAKELDGITFGNIITVAKDLFGSIVDYIGKTIFGMDDINSSIEDAGYTIGEVVKNDIAGPFEGAVDKVNALGKSIGGFLKNIAGKFRDDIGMGEILTMIFGGGMIYAMTKENKLFAAIKEFAESFSGIGTSIQNVLNTTSDTIASFQKEIKAKQIVYIAAAIAALATSIYLLCTIDDPKKIAIAVGAILVLAGALVALSYFVSKINSCESVEIKPNIILTLLGLAAAVGAIVIAFNAIKIDPDTYVVQWGILMSFIIALGVLAVAMSKASGPAGTCIKAAGLFVGMGVALNLIVLAFKFLDTCNPETLTKNVFLVIELIAAMSLLALALGVVKPKAGSFMVLMGMASSLLLVITALHMLAILPIESISKAMEPIKTLLLLFIAVMAISRLAGEHAAKAGAAILMVSVAINLLIGAIYACSLLPASAVKKSTEVIGKILAMFALLIFVSGVAGEFANKAGVLLICAGAAMVLFSIVAFILSIIDPKGLKSAVNAMSQLMVFMSILVAASGFARRVKPGPFIAIATALGILMIALGALTMIEDQSALWSAVGAISVIMFMLGVVIASSKLAGESIKPLIVITAAVGLIGGLLIAMSLLKVENTIINATAIGILMAALAGAFWVIGKTGEVSLKAVGAIAIMTAIMAGLGVILALMSSWNVQNAIVNAGGIAILMMTLSGAFWVISKSGDDIAKALGVTGVMSILILAMGGVLKLLQWADIDNAIENALACSVLVVAIGGICALLSKLKVNVAAACDAALGVVGFVSIIGILMAGIFALFGWIHEDVMEKIQNGIDNLCLIFEGLGKAVGSIITGLGEGLTSGLPEIGENIAGFAMAFSTISPKTASSMKMIGEALLSLTGAQLLDGLSKLLGFLVGDQSISDFGGSLSKLAEGMKTFATETDGISWDTVGPACEAASKIMEICNLIPNSGGLLAKIIGDNTADDFGITLNALGVGIADFALMTSGKDWSGVDPACDAAKKIIEICNLIPNSKGLLSFIMGNNNPGAFGISLEDFGDGLAKFAASVLGVDWSGLPDAQKNMEYIKAICEQIPDDENSWIDKLVGNEDKWTEFGNGLKSLGSSMAIYASQVTGITWTDISASATAINDLRAISQGLPLEKDDKKRVSMEDFGKNLVKFGIQLVKFSKNTEDIDVARMNLFAESFKSFAFAMDQVQWFDPKKFDNFSKSIKRLGDVSIAELENTFKEGGGKVKASLETVINVIKKTINENADAMTIKLSAKVANGENAEDLDSAGKALIAAFNSAIDEALAELKAKEVDFSSEGSHYVIELMNGFDSAKNLFIAELKRVSEEAVAEISADKFFKTGEYCAVGLVDGIKSKMNLVKMAGTNLGLTVLMATRKALRIHSPSKDYEDTGKYCDKGFENGIEENMDGPVKMAKALGKAVCEVSNEIKEQANKDFTEATADMDFGTDVLRNYLNTYGEFSGDVKKNSEMIANAKNLVLLYAESLYESSGQFDKDIEKVKKCNEKMAELRLEKAQLDAKLASADEKERAKLASQQESLNKKIMDCNKELEESITTISDNIAKAYNKVRESIVETTKAALDFTKVDNSTGVNLLADPEKTKSKVKVKDKKTGKFTEKEVEEAVENPVQIMEKELNKFKDFRKKIEELGKTGLCDGLLKQLEALGPEGVEKIDEFLKLTGDEISKANEYYKENLKLSADVFLDNYAKTIQIQKDFATNINKLASMNFDKGIIEALGKAGAEGSAQYMESFLSMTPEQVKEFNKKYAETLKVPDEVATDVMTAIVATGERSAEGFKSGIESKLESVLEAYKEVAVYPPSQIADASYAEMFKVGEYSPQGFVDGANSWWNKFKNSKFGKPIFGDDGGAIGVAMSTLDENSPSKEFKKIGRYVSEGFAVGVDEYAHLATDSVSKMASGATDNAIKAISGIDEAMVRKAEYGVRVKPVVQMDKFKATTSTLNVTPIVNDAQIKPINQTNAILKHVETAIARNNADMTNSMRTLSQDMVNAMNEAYMTREVALYVDGRKMASTLAQPMSREFRVLSNRGL